jgi:hypothetical protein
VCYHVALGTSYAIGIQSRDHLGYFVHVISAIYDVVNVGGDEGMFITHFIFLFCPECESPDISEVYIRKLEIQVFCV